MTTTPASALQATADAIFALAAEATPAMMANPASALRAAADVADAFHNLAVVLREYAAQIAILSPLHARYMSHARAADAFVTGIAEATAAWAVAVEAAVPDMASRAEDIVE